MAVPTQTAADVAADFSTLEFVIQALLGRTATAQLVAVKACTNSGGLSQWGTVDVIPLVNQVAGDGTNVPHGTLYKLPYKRLQGGKNAVIIDPEPGDIGLAVFAMRDISSVKSNPVSAVKNATGTAGTPPGSARQYDLADGCYFGGFLNVTPTQYVRFSPAGIEIHSPVKVIVTAPGIDLIADTVVNIQAPTINLKGTVAQTAGPVTMAQTLAVTGDASVGGGLSVTGTTTGTGAANFTGGVTGQGVPLKGHAHAPGSYTAGATPVTGNSAPT